MDTGSSSGLIAFIARSSTGGSWSARPMSTGPPVGAWYVFGEPCRRLRITRKKRRKGKKKRCVSTTSAQSAELAGPTWPDDKCAPGGDKKESRIVQLRLVRATIPDWEWMGTAHASQDEARVTKQLGTRRENKISSRMMGHNRVGPPTRG